MTRAALLILFLVATCVPTVQATDAPQVTAYCTEATDGGHSTCLFTVYQSGHATTDATDATLPIFTASCVGRIEAPGKLCQFRVVQERGSVLVVAVSGPYAPALEWWPFVIDADPLVWGIDWMTGPIPCRSLELVELTLSRAVGTIAYPYKWLRLHSYCLVMPEMFKVQ